MSHNPPHHPMDKARVTSFKGVPELKPWAEEDLWYYDENGIRRKFLDWETHSKKFWKPESPIRDISEYEKIPSDVEEALHTLAQIWQTFLIRSGYAITDKDRLILKEVFEEDEEVPEYYISLSPGVCSGEPTLNGRRIRVSHVLDLMEQGLDPLEICEDLVIPHEQLEVVLDNCSHIKENT